MHHENVHINFTTVLIRDMITKIGNECPQNRRE